MRGLAVAAAVAATLVIAACGQEAQTTPAELELARQEATGAQPPSGSAPKGEDPSAAAVRSSGSEEGRTAEQFLQGYFQDILDGRYQRAWSTLTPTVQDQFGGFADWRAGYAQTQSSEVSEVEEVDSSGEETTVSFELLARDLDECGDVAEQEFAGTWVLEETAETFTVTSASFEKLSGDTPVTDPAAC